MECSITSSSSTRSPSLGLHSSPHGMINADDLQLDADMVAPSRNQGGFQMIGSGRTTIESPSYIEAVRNTVQELQLDALVVVGGDDSNRNSMKLAEDSCAHGFECCVNAATETIDTNCVTPRFSLAFHAVSARKPYHSIRIMGRSASVIAMECAPRAHPNLCLIAEEVRYNSTTLTDISGELFTLNPLIPLIPCMSNTHGVIVLPEGLVEFIPDVEALISELNKIMAHSEKHLTRDEITAALSATNAELFSKLPEAIANQLMLERDPHGNFQVAKIEAQRLLIGMAPAKLSVLTKPGLFKVKFSGVPHYVCHQGRCVMHLNFDANYNYGLGRVAAALCFNTSTRYVGTLSNLRKAP
ncbi:Phosphofructokinase [Gracilaria domingensis]|nr:Phosphofructokinase [Gracilaria domingensis]